MRNSERAHTGAHEESKGVPVRIIVDAHTPQLIERKGMLRMFKELKKKGKEERRGGETHRAAEDGPNEARKTDDALRDAVRVAHNVRWRH